MTRAGTDAFPLIVRRDEAEMAARTRGLPRPRPVLPAVSLGAVALAIVVAGLPGLLPLYAIAILVTVALLTGLVRVVVHEWHSGPPSSA